MSSGEKALSIKPIRTDEQYQDAIKRAARLIPQTDGDSVDELLVLQAVIEQWERSRFTFSVSPAEAIKFRMEQGGIQRRDLVPILGTKSRVSEILSGQRQLTVDQIRALNRHFGIPTEALIGTSRYEPSSGRSTASGAAIAKLREMKVMRPGEAIEAFLARGTKISPAVAMLRKTRTDRTNAKTDLGALEAWCSAVLLKTVAEKLPTATLNRKKSRSFARQIAKLSVEVDGPRLAAEFLKSIGVIFVTMDHLPGTFLDGAAICREDGTPIIALTLRHDRLDNFWFTLLHEFAHVCLHLGKVAQVIVDDLEVKSSAGMETEADDFAREALIPETAWSRLHSLEPDTAAIEGVAAEAEGHPAIVAGRWRFENSDYRRFSKLLGHGQVRSAFA